MRHHLAAVGVLAAGSHLWTSKTLPPYPWFTSMPAATTQLSPLHLTTVSMRVALHHDMTALCAHWPFQPLSSHRRCHRVEVRGERASCCSDLHGATANLSRAMLQGTCGFKGARKGTSYAGQVAGTEAGKVASEKGIESVRALVKGLGPGRAVRTHACLHVGQGDLFFCACFCNTEERIHTQ